jgi:peptidoglycan/LPS O-acetylase OafA/YrhL
MAVLAVMFHHLHRSLVPGGYLGVDIFFVLSGYLIIGGILRDLQRGAFQLLDFYQRRIKRILPAIFAVTLAVMVVGFLVFPACTLFGLGSSVAMSACFCLNFGLHGILEDYFAKNIQLQPLLHLWSLGVEEQFYLAIPVVVFLVWKFAGRRAWIPLAVLLGLSMAGAIHAINSGHPMSAFYLPQFRAWELLAGGLLAKVHLTRRISAPGGSSPVTPGPLTRLFGSKGLQNGILFSGFGLILVAIFGFRPETTNPILAGLVATAGTLVLIHVGPLSWGGRILGLKPLNRIGKMSYSLYLWHWPVMMYWKYIVYDDLHYYDYLGMLALAGTLGYLSWRYLENPLRKATFWTVRSAFGFAFSGVLILTLMGTTVSYFRGWPKQLHPAANAIEDQFLVKDPILVRTADALLRRLGELRGRPFAFRQERERMVRDQDVSLKYKTVDDCLLLGAMVPPRLLMVGDSHAQALRFGMDQVLRERGEAALSIARSSTDLFDLDKPEANRALGLLDERPNIDSVIIVQRWMRHLDKLTTAGDLQATMVRLEKFVIALRGRGKKVYVLMDVPTFKTSYTWDEPRMRIISPRRGRPPLDSYAQSMSDYREDQGEINQLLRDLCGRTQAILIPLPAFLKVGQQLSSLECRNGAEVPLFYDLHHFSRQGSIRAASYLLPIISGSLQAPPVGEEWSRKNGTAPARVPQETGNPLPAPPAAVGR